jgi:hypothetical protein
VANKQESSFHPKLKVKKSVSTPPHELACYSGPACTVKNSRRREGNLRFLHFKNRFKNVSRFNPLNKSTLKEPKSVYKV